MKTLAFIGSDKNAGKTTAMNLVASKLMLPNCISSIGLNGETQDNLTGESKPVIKIAMGNYFLTATKHLHNLSGSYQILNIFTPPTFFKTFVLGKANSEFELILEGPNDKQSWITVKDEITKILPKGTLLIDGSIDRQFIAHPEISDTFYFSLLISSRKDQLEKAKNLLAPLSLQDCPRKLQKILNKLSAKSIILDKSKKPIYIGSTIPFLDQSLVSILKNTNEPILYLEGALTTTLAKKIDSIQNLTIILNNFTLYQTTYSTKGAIYLLHPVHVQKIFIKEEEECDILIPKGIGVTNIFRESINEIAI